MTKSESRLKFYILVYLVNMCEQIKREGETVKDLTRAVAKFLVHDWGI